MTQHSPEINHVKLLMLKQFLDDSISLKDSFTVLRLIGRSIHDIDETNYEGCACARIENNDENLF